MQRMEPLLEKLQRINVGLTFNWRKMGFCDSHPSTELCTLIIAVGVNDYGRPIASIRTPTVSVEA